MMVFYKANLALLSMPKTGSTAYERALRPHADLAITGPPLLKHQAVYRYNRFIRPMFKIVCDADLDVMAVMREPISWLGSWWRYRQRDDMIGQPNSTHGISFDDFVLAYMKGDRPPFAEVGNQSVFLKPQPNGTAVKYLFRYEDQDTILAFLEAKLNAKLDIGYENASPPMPVALSASVETRFRQKFAEQFALYDSIEPIKA